MNKYLTRIRKQIGNLFPKQDERFIGTYFHVFMVVVLAQGETDESEVWHMLVDLTVYMSTVSTFESTPPSTTAVVLYRYLVECWNKPVAYTHLATTKR